MIFQCDISDFFQIYLLCLLIKNSSHLSDEHDDGTSTDCIFSDIFTFTFNLIHNFLRHEVFEGNEQTRPRP